jgi:hypothetical protein
MPVDLPHVAPGKEGSGDQLEADAALVANRNAGCGVRTHTLRRQPLLSGRSGSVGSRQFAGCDSRRRISCIPGANGSATLDQHDDRQPGSPDRGIISWFA